jgi:hypothetical protein
MKVLVDEQAKYAALEAEAILNEHNALEAAKVAEADAAAKAKKSVVPSKYKARYAQAGHAGTCGDELASWLTSATMTPTGVDLVALRSIASLNGIDAEARWGHLNPGMQRMNLGNVLRQMVKTGRKVVRS